MRFLRLVTLLALAAPLACRAEGKVIPRPEVGTRPGHAGAGTPLQAAPGHQLAMFAQGCFWGSEHRFRQVKGVTATAVGYAGGHTAKPSYEDVCSDQTGHAETVLVEFDPAVVSYEQLLALFWSSHDPTSGNRQGPDTGSQYRSAIFALDDAQLAAAQRSRDAEQAKLADPITTEIAKASPFWLAETYHQQWDEKHGIESCPIPHRPRSKAAP